MEKPPNRSAMPSLAILAIALAFCGQYVLGLGETPNAWMLPCFALAVGCLLLADRLARR